MNHMNKNFIIYLNKPPPSYRYYREVSCKPSFATQSPLRIYLLSSILKYFQLCLNPTSLSSKFDAWTCKIDAFIGVLAWFQFQFPPESTLSFSMSVPHSKWRTIFCPKSFVLSLSPQALTHLRRANLTYN